MSPQDIAALKEAFSESLAPLWEELKSIHTTLGGHGQMLREQGQLLQSIDNRLTNVEGILSGVEILVRKKAG